MTYRTSANHHLSAWQARIWLSQGKLGLVSQWVDERPLNPDGESLHTQHEKANIVLARFLIVQGALDEATSLLDRLLEGAETGGRTSSVIEILLLQTLAANARGQTAQAMHALRHALTLAEPGGFIRIFVDEGAAGRSSPERGAEPVIHRFVYCRTHIKHLYRKLSDQSF